MLMHNVPRLISIPYFRPRKPNRTPLLWLPKARHTRHPHTDQIESLDLGAWIVDRDVAGRFVGRSCQCAVGSAVWRDKGGIVEGGDQNVLQAEGEVVDGDGGRFLERCGLGEVVELGGRFAYLSKWEKKRVSRMESSRIEGMEGDQREDREGGSHYCGIG